MNPQLSLYQCKTCDQTFKTLIAVIRHGQYYGHNLLRKKTDRNNFRCLCKFLSPLHESDQDTKCEAKVPVKDPTAVNETEIKLNVAKNKTVLESGNTKLVTIEIVPSF